MFYSQNAVHINYTEIRGVWPLVQQRIKRWSKDVFFTLMATDGALKLNYASVIFVDTGVYID